jgi:hypothetical protein
MESGIFSRVSRGFASFAFGLRAALGRSLMLAICAFAVAAPASIAQERRVLGKPRAVHVVYMGGNDCPPCVAWRASELPKLEQTEIFRLVRFSMVTKTVRSPVPAAAFLPDEVKPYKARLDLASGGNIGSAQVAILVDGEVYDYSFAAPPAEDFEQRLIAAYWGLPDAIPRCLQRGPKWSCITPVQTLR